VRAVGRWLPAGWLLVALVLLAVEGRLLVLLAWAVPASLLALAVGALVRWQRRPSMLDRPTVPERHRVADDLRQPIVAVVAVAEHEATIGAVIHNDVPGWAAIDEISQER
jgi:hypothetical protein